VQQDVVEDEAVRLYGVEPVGDGLLEVVLFGVVQ